MKGPTETTSLLAETHTTSPTINDITRNNTYGSSDKTSGGLVLAWNNLSVQVTSESTGVGKSCPNPAKQVLNNVTGAVEGGTLLAVIGSSGAGKTTLLSTLSKRIQKNMNVKGDIIINGRQVDDVISKEIGYVDQQDLFLPSLTVKEHLTFMARMKMSQQEKFSTVKFKVNEVMDDLGLTSVQHTKIGAPNFEKGISGGERKRLSFASEILTDPPILFCDEPTTGLDSYNALRVVKVLRKFASRGQTIIITIHQPSSELWVLFDQVLMLSEGQTAFLGTLAQAKLFYESQGYSCPPSYNPADFYIHTLAVLPGHEAQSLERINRICAAFKNSEYSRKHFGVIQRQTNLALAYIDSKVTQKESLREHGTIRKAGFGLQLYWLVWRSFLDTSRNPKITRTKLMQRLIIGLLMGISYYGTTDLNQEGVQNRGGAIYLLTVNNYSQAIFGCLAFLDPEVPLFLREYKSDVYGCVPYYLSKMMSMLPGMVLWSLAYCLAIYWLVGLRVEFYYFLMTLVTLSLNGAVSGSFGLMLASAFKKFDTRMLFLLPFQQFMFTTGGYMMKLGTMPSWLSWTMWFSWLTAAFESISIIQWEGITNIACDEPNDISCLSNGEQVLDHLAIDPMTLDDNFAQMVLLYALFSILGLFALMRKAKMN